MFGAGVLVGDQDPSPTGKEALKESLTESLRGFLKESCKGSLKESPKGSLKGFPCGDSYIKDIP